MVKLIALLVTLFSITSTAMDRQFTDKFNQNLESDLFYFAKGHNFNEELKRFLDQHFIQEVQHDIFMVDFDGVLASCWFVLNNIEFYDIANTANLILSDQVNSAIDKLINEDQYADYLLTILFRITGNAIPSDKKEQQLVIKRFLSFVRSGVISNSSDFADFDVRYKVVNEELFDILKLHQSLGAKLFVLSARPYARKKGKFLKEQYPGIFVKNNFKRKLSETIGVNGYKKKRSYIYSEKKYDVLAHIPTWNNEETFRITFLDDNVDAMEAYQIKVNNAVSSDNPSITYLFIPYYMLSINFDEDNFIKELYLLAKIIDDKLVDFFLKN